MNSRRRKLIKFFISYSHTDRVWLDRLHVHLKPLQRNYDIDIWDDTRLTPGSNWQAEIERAVKAAKVAILLVSADFLASEFITTNELPRLLESAQKEGARILSVIVSPCAFARHPNLSQFQAVNNPSEPLTSMAWDKQERVFDKLAVEIENFLKATPSRQHKQGKIGLAHILEKGEGLRTSQELEAVPGKERTARGPNEASVPAVTIGGRESEQFPARGGIWRLRPALVVSVLILLVVASAAVWLAGKHLASNRAIEPSVSGPIGDNQVKVKVQKEDTAALLGNNLFIQLKRTELNEETGKYKVLASISSPGNPPLDILDEEAAAETTYSYPKTRDFKIWVLSADDNSAQFLVERTGS